MGHDYFKEPRSVLAMRAGEVCMKYPDHHMRHPCGHLAIEQVPKEQEVARGATLNLDAGKTLCWAGATPLSHTVPWPK
jgi:hypothetical protein